MPQRRGEDASIGALCDSCEDHGTGANAKAETADDHRHRHRAVSLDDGETRSDAGRLPSQWNPE